MIKEYIYNGDRFSECVAKMGEWLRENREKVVREDFIMQSIHVDTYPTRFELCIRYSDLRDFKKSKHLK